MDVGIARNVTTLEYVASTYGQITIDKPGLARGGIVEIVTHTVSKAMTDRKSVV